MSSTKITPSLCCLLAEPTKQQKYKTITVANANKLTAAEREKRIRSIWEHNVSVACEIVRWCRERDWNYRLPSSIFPLFTHPIAANVKRPNLDPLGKQVRLMRISMHPDQFNVLASANPKVVDNTICELNYHGWVLDHLNQPHNHSAPINVHMNCYKGSPLKVIAKRFFDAFIRLDVSVSNRLTLENEDKPNSWSVSELHEHIYEEKGIPITYDSLHHRCNPRGLDNQTAFDLARKTWHGVKPLFHFSDAPSGAKNPRAHADYPDSDGFPLEFDTFPGELDLDFEFKLKELAIQVWEDTYYNLTSS